MSDHFDPYHVWLGIPPEEQPPTHYRLLGLRSLESDPDVISNALDQRLAFLRTFQAGKRVALSQKLLNEVSAAGGVLLNPEKKDRYDRSLTGSAVTPAAPAASTLPLPVARPFPPALAQPAMPWSSSQGASALPEPSVPPARSVSLPQKPARQATVLNREESAINPHLAPLMAAGVGLLGLVALAIGGWWLLSGTSDDPVEGPEVVHQESSGKAGKTDLRSGNDDVAGKRGGTSEVPAATVTAADKQIWLADAPAQRVFRRDGNRWIDYRDRSEDWYQPGPLGGSQVRLSDPARRLQIELFDDRAEILHVQSIPAVAHSGRWISEAELPEFAKRPPATSQPNPLRWRGTTWHALVLDGNSSISLPVPPEIAGAGADFTIEMWVRFDAKFPESRLLLAGPLELHTTRPRLAVGGPPSMLMADLKSGPLGIAVRPPVLGDRWHHWAVVRAGRQLKLFIDGQSRAALPLEDSFAIAAQSLLLGGRGQQQSPNLGGMIRDVRISRGARYTQSFRPSLRFALDDQTLVLPKFQASQGDQLDDLSGHGHHGSRGTTQWLPLSLDEGIVQAELPADFVDLEWAFIASIHTLRGNTEGNPAHHDTTNGQGVCQMLVPYQPTGDYDLEFEVTRLEGEGGLLLGVVLGPERKQLAVAVNAFADSRGPYTGILPTELSQVAPRPCLVQHESKLVTGQKQRVVVEVRNPASNRYALYVTIDGTTVCNVNDFLGNAALSPALTMPQKAALFWGSHNAKIRYHAMRLLPPGKATPAATAVASTGSINTTPPFAATSTPSGSSTPPASTSQASPAASAASSGGTPINPPPTGQPLVPTPRLPAPSAEEHARRLADARKAFEVQLKEATKPAQKASLARIILTAADNTKSDTTARYVLVDLARKVFIQAGEVSQALATARTLEKEFDVAEDELLIATIEALDAMTLPPEQRTILAKTSIDLADELLAAEEFDQAETLATIASQSAGKQKDTELRKDIVPRRGQIVRVAAAARVAQPGIALLLTKPDDPAANLAVGKFRALVLEDWETGLVHLVKCGDPRFSGPASLDLATSSAQPADLVAAGEAWLRLAADAKAISRDDRPALERRARLHLTAALPSLVGLERERIKRRLDEIKEVGAATAKRPAKSRTPRVTAVPGLIGRVAVRGQDAGVIVTYQPGYTVSPEDVQELQAAAGVTPADQFQIDLMGILTLAADSELELRHVGGSSSGGVHTFFLGTQNISEIGDDRTKDQTQKFTLAKGPHATRWALTGGDLGTAQLSVVAIDAAGKPKPGVATILITRELSNLVHSIPYKTEIKWGAP